MLVRNKKAALAIHMAIDDEFTLREEEPPSLGGEYGLR